MQQYLRDEEAALMSELKQEEEEKSQRMKEKIDRINNDIQVLTSSIRETEEAMGLDDFVFLKVIPIPRQQGASNCEILFTLIPSYSFVHRGPGLYATKIQFRQFGNVKPSNSLKQTFFHQFMGNIYTFTSQQMNCTWSFVF